MDEKRLIKIETKLAFQEETSEQLSEVLRDQQSQLDTLSRSLRQLAARIEQAEKFAEPDQIPDEKPPHY